MRGHANSQQVGTSSAAVNLRAALSMDEDAKTARFGDVTKLLKKAAYLPLFSMPNPKEPDVPIPLVPILADFIPFLSNFLLTGVYVNEAPHRLTVDVTEPTAARGLGAAHVVGEEAAVINVHFAITPDDFQAGPGRVPPPTLFVPFLSQRFSFPEGQFKFLDKQQSGFQGFGAGRTFPIRLGNQLIPQIRIVGIIEILQGLGKFAGLQGVVVVNGEIKPPNELALFMVPRLMDPNDILKAHTPPPIEHLTPVPDPDPTASFLFFLAEPDPHHPMTINRAGDGRMLGVNLFERLRLARVEFDIDTPQDIRSQTLEGPIVGSHRSTLVFDPQAPTDVTPLFSRDDLYTFYDNEGKTIGTLRADLIEGRAFRTQLNGTSHPVFRIGGGGPFLEGSGQFIGVQGLATVNGVISLSPGTLSSLYMLRIIDMDGRFRAGLGSARH